MNLEVAVNRIRDFKQEGAVGEVMGVIEELDEGNDVYLDGIRDAKVRKKMRHLFYALGLQGTDTPEGKCFSTGGTPPLADALWHRLGTRDEYRAPRGGTPLLPSAPPELDIEEVTELLKDVNQDVVGGLEGASGAPPPPAEAVGPRRHDWMLGPEVFDTGREAPKVDRKRDNTLRRGVEEYNKKFRSTALKDMERPGEIKLPVVHDPWGKSEFEQKRQNEPKEGSDPWQHFDPLKDLQRATASKPKLVPEEERTKRFNARFTEGRFL